MNINKKIKKICVCTSLAAEQEPRAPRHAEWIASIGDSVEVVFVDCAPAGVDRKEIKALHDHKNMVWRSLLFGTRKSNRVRWLLQHAQQQFQMGVFAIGGPILPVALSSRVVGLEKLLKYIGADIYFAHNVETLLPASRAAEKNNALLMFDSMEFHSDMGEGQSILLQSMIKEIEKATLPKCAMVVTSSAEVAEALSETYSIPVPTPVENVPPIEIILPEKPANGLALYWRNSVLGLGQRGLDEVLVAMVGLPKDVSLHLQGRLATDGGVALKARIAELGLDSRVIFHPTYLPEMAVVEASRHHVGLCLERKGCRNHELTTSNKIFDYHMGGLAVIVSDLPGLKGVVERSGGGLLFEPGNPEDLRKKISILYQNRNLMKNMAEKSRQFALMEANRTVKKEIFLSKFKTFLNQ